MSKDDAYKDGPQWDNDPDDDLDLESYVGRLAKCVTIVWHTLRSPNTLIGSDAQKWVDQHQNDLAMICIVMVATYNDAFGHDMQDLMFENELEHVGGKLNELCNLTDVIARFEESE